MLVSIVFFLFFSLLFSLSNESQKIVKDDGGQ